MNRGAPCADVGFVGNRVATPASPPQRPPLIHDYLCNGTGANMMELKTRSPLLKLGPGEKKIAKSLSAVAFVGEHLLLGSDELNSKKENSIERLSTADGLTFENHKSLPLTGLVTLRPPAAEKDQEIDIEGLDTDGKHLWILGSHSLKRSKVE